MSLQLFVFSISNSKVPFHMRPYAVVYNLQIGYHETVVQALAWGWETADSGHHWAPSLQPQVSAYSQCIVEDNPTPITTPSRKLYLPQWGKSF